MKVPENETSWEAIESVIILPTAASLLFWWEVELYLWNGGIPALYLFGLWAQNFCQSLHEQGNLSVLSECSCVGGKQWRLSEFSAMEVILVETGLMPFI